MDKQTIVDYIEENPTVEQLYRPLSTSRQTNVLQQEE